MDGIVKHVALAVLLLALPCLGACGQQENSPPKSSADATCGAAHREAPDKRVLWTMLLAAAEAYEPESVRVKRSDGTEVETLSIPLRRPEEEDAREHLDGIAYPGADKIEAVRCYAASVLRRGIEARRIFRSDDREVDLLAPVARSSPSPLCSWLYSA